ncbi:transport protein [Klebsiella pneumoniae]|nr:transport protein [Klebsiella pneumoniae]
MDKNSSDGVPLPQRYGAILTIVLGLTMAVLDGAIANVALPTIASDLNASPAASIWIVNAYQIAIVIALLPLSFLGDMVGYRRIYKIGLVVFIFTSLACALSRSLEMLTFARVAQGLGGAALMSVNTALIRLIYPQRFLGRGMGINSFVVAVSSAAGPTIAAAILSLASWQWLFLINVPLGIVAFVLAMRFLPPNSARSKIIRFDLPSAIMNALTFGLLITALSGFRPGAVHSAGAGGGRRYAGGGVLLRSPASSRCPSPCCRSTCCVSHSSLSLSALPSAPSARRCWRWSPCPFFCSR